MAQMFIWLGLFLGIALLLVALIRENDRRKHRTVAEWERDFAAGQGKMTQFLRAGALGLESVIVDEKRHAVEFMKDEQQGMTRTGDKGDDADRTAAN